jgi:hypothetical protein
VFLHPLAKAYMAFLVDVTGPLNSFNKLLQA